MTFIYTKNLIMKIILNLTKTDDRRAERETGAQTEFRDSWKLSCTKPEKVRTASS